jgi:hypothetical protein
MDFLDFGANAGQIDYSLPRMLHIKNDDFSFVHNSDRNMRSRKSYGVLPVSFEKIMYFAFCKFFFAMLQCSIFPFCSLTFFVLTKLLFFKQLRDISFTPYSLGLAIVPVLEVNHVNDVVDMPPLAHTLPVDETFDHNVPEDDLMEDVGNHQEIVRFLFRLPFY